MAEKKEQTLKERIDADEGLKSKRLLLTVISVIVIGVSLADIKIAGINTLIFNLEVGRKDGIALLLVLTVAFLMVRYFTYARKYHDDLTTLWKKEFMNDNEIRNSDYDSMGIPGLMYIAAPKWYYADFDITSYEKITRNFYIRCEFLFFCYFDYSSYHDDHDMERAESVNILRELGFINYLKVIRKKLKYQVAGFIKYPESLDIYAPYLIATVAIFSYIVSSYISVS